MAGQKAKVTKAEISDAQETWSNFTVLMKWSLISTIAVLVLLAILFL
jgi:hypothetical protein